MDKVINITTIITMMTMMASLMSDFLRRSFDVLQPPLLNLLLPTLRIPLHVLLELTASEETCATAALVVLLLQGAMEQQQYSSPQELKKPPCSTDIGALAALI